MMIVRGAGGALIALCLAGCAGGSFGGSTPPAAEAGVPGRWILAAPNAPMCGMNFTGVAGAREGIVSPDGGCPGKFFMSRRWTIDQGVLLINDDDNQPLAKLSNAGDRFEGQSTTGLPVTLARPTPPPG